MWPYPQETVYFVTFTAEIRNRKFYFCAVKEVQKWFRTSFRSSENTLRVLKQMGESGAHSELNQTSKIKLFVKIANIFHALIVIPKSSIWDVWLGSKCASWSFISIHAIFVSSHCSQFLHPENINNFRGICLICVKE